MYRIFQTLCSLESVIMPLQFIITGENSNTEAVPIISYSFAPESSPNVILSKTAISIAIKFCFYFTSFTGTVSVSFSGKTSVIRLVSHI